jgi:hypothetical protein
VRRDVGTSWDSQRDGRRRRSLATAARRGCPVSLEVEDGAGTRV